MNKITRIIQLVIILFSTYSLFPQSIEDEFKIPDSLKNSTYEDIYERFIGNYEDTLKSQIYLRSCLEKARLNMEGIKMAKAYVMLFYYERNDTLKLGFLDRSIKLSEKLNDSIYPAYSYSSRGGFYLGKWDYEKALDNYLLALTFTKRNNNKSFQYVTKHNIGIIKSKLRKHKEALDIFKECLEYEERKGIENDTLDYLDLMVDLIESYTKNGMIDSSNYYLEKVLPISKRQDRDLHSKFVFNQGINFYYNKKYVEAEKTFKKSLPNLSRLEDKREMVNSFFYLGKINESMSNEDETIYYYKKVDSVFKQTKFITPEVREGYLFLINYYKGKQDFKNQLLYVERLLKFDSILHQNSALINEKLIRKYDTTELLAEKEKLIEFVHSKNSNFKMFILILTITSLFLIILLCYQYHKRKLYAKRFKVLIEENAHSISVDVKNTSKDTIKVAEKRSLKISEDIKEDILHRIEKFEKNLGFLEHNITTNSLAIQFKTNSKYISRVVNTYKGKNFTNYINDLRIDYLIQELKTNKKLRNYTMKAISSEVGFNTTEAFSKYFHKKTGIYPSYFIKRMVEYVD